MVVASHGYPSDCISGVHRYDCVDNVSCVPLPEFHQESEQSREEASRFGAIRDRGRASSYSREKLERRESHQAIDRESIRHPDGRVLSSRQLRMPSRQSRSEII